MLVFLYHCISDGNQLFSENVGCHFHFILHLMSDKAAFVSGALFYVKRYRGKLELSRFNSASCWQIINLHIYAATNSVSLWDYGMNKFNCLTVSVQFQCYLTAIRTYFARWLIHTNSYDLTRTNCLNPSDE